jgi:hypothetical protein
MDDIELHFSPSLNGGRFRRERHKADAGWSRLSSTAQVVNAEVQISELEIVTDWPSALDLVRELSPLQRPLNFRFVPAGLAKERVAAFMADHRALQAVDTSNALTDEEIVERLTNSGWDFSKRTPTLKQMETLRTLSEWRNGANFSVPGAGKTTVTFALHLLVDARAPYLIVVAPPNAFLSWKDVAGECLRAEVAAKPLDRFTVLRTGMSMASLRSQGLRRFLISYETLVAMEGEVGGFLATQATHFVADESHKFKGGYRNQRGSTMLRLSHLAVRRDILSGTPMPQGPADVQSQMDFLWPGVGLGARIVRGEDPASVMRGRFVRTNKRDLNLPDKQLHFEDVSMKGAHRALYCVVRDEVLRQASDLRRNAEEVLRARRSVIRLLQMSANPVAALAAMTGDDPEAAARTDQTRALYAAVLNEGPSAKVLRAEELVRSFAALGKKCLVWSVFSQTIEDLERLLADLNPVVIRGGVKSGEIEDIESREGRIERFRTDPRCMVMIANPAAASEGMSLHMQCHHAIYVDRSFNAIHYLQSIDRIHRLGLPPDVETHIYILRNLVPEGFGSVDLSVSRRLARKIRALEELLNDPDLHELALEEENSGDGVEYGIDADDIADLVREIEGGAARGEEDDHFA